MKCPFPIRIKNEKPTALSPEPYYYVPCGKCAVCFQNKRRQWFVRLRDELQYSENAIFLTLTYDEEFFYTHYYNSEKKSYVEFEKINEMVLDISSVSPRSVAKKDLQDFIKRFRYYDGSENIRYYAVGEYGTKSLRPHYHLLLFNVNVFQLNSSIQRAWQFGNFFMGSVSDASINYVSGYIISRHIKPDGCDPSFAIMSRKPAIGTAKLNKMKSYYKDNLINYVTLPGGIKTILPRFYKDKIFNKFDKFKILKQLQEKEIEDIDDLKYERILLNNELALQRITKNKKF